MDFARAQSLFKSQAEAVRSRQQRGSVLIEQKYRCVVGARRSRHDELSSDGRFSRPGRPEQQSAGTALDAAAQQHVQRLDSTCYRLTVERTAVVSRNQTRKYENSAAPDREVVLAAGKIAAA